MFDVERRFAPEMLGQTDPIASETLSFDLPCK